MSRWWPWAALLLIATATGYSWLTEGIVRALLDSRSDAGAKVAALQQYFREMGPLAPVSYVLFVTAEVVLAPIPGVLLYAPGGIIFGPVVGGGLAIIGNTLGAGISCGLVRSFGPAISNRLFGTPAAHQLQRELERRGAVLIVLLRFNPLTSTDLLSYAAGATQIPILTVMLATGLGMTPACLIQSWLSDSLFTRFPWLIYPLLVLSVIYIIVVVLIIRRLMRRATQVADDGSIIQHDS